MQLRAVTEQSVEESPKKEKLKKIDLCIVFSAVLNRQVISDQWAVFDQSFHVLKDEYGVHQYVEELPGQVLRQVERQRVVDCLISYFHHKCFHIQGTDLKPDDFSNFVKYWAAITKPLDAKDIAPVRTETRPGFTWHRLPFDLNPGPHPIWDELMGRMSNSQALMAWIGSLFDPTADRQQYVWIWGEGRNGKGSLGRFLSKVFGPATRWDQVPDKNDRFWTSGLIGKRLVIFGDCNHYGFPATGLFKGLTGGDHVRFERKNQSSFSGQLISKFLFLSNDEPAISSQKADMRRVIFCRAQETDADYGPQYETMLWGESSAFLFTCWQAYKKAAPDGGTIEADTTEIEEVASFMEEHHSVIFEKYFEPCFDAEKIARDRSFVSPIKMQELLRYEGLKTTVQRSSFFKWMKRTHKVCHSQVRLSEKIEWRYLGLKEVRNVNSIMDRPAN